MFSSLNNEFATPFYFRIGVTGMVSRVTHWPFPIVSLLWFFSCWCRFLVSTSCWCSNLLASMFFSYAHLMCNTYVQRLMTPHVSSSTQVVVCWFVRFKDATLVKKKHLPNDRFLSKSTKVVGSSELMVPPLSESRVAPKKKWCDSPKKIHLASDRFIKIDPMWPCMYAK